MSTPSRMPRPFEPPPDVGLGLRLRIWIGCLAGALVAATGLWLAVLWVSAKGEAVNSTLIWVWLPVIATSGILLGLAMALWLDHGIVTPVRAHLRALRSGNVAELRGTPSASGWGEVSALTQELQEYLAHHREATNAVVALQRLQHDIDASRAMLDHWLQSERWEALPERAAALAELTRRLNAGMAREQEVHDQNHEASLQIQEDLAASVAEARASAEQTEQGFVQATSLLTTVRELERLTADLTRHAIVPDATASEHASQDYRRVRETASAAIAELAQASAESVGHLSTALLRVREVGAQVQMLGNRATLLALNVMMARSEADTSADDASAELRALAREVRIATERAAACTHDVEQEVEHSSKRMQVVRARVAETMAQIPERIETAPGTPLPDVTRLVERAREMVQDATSKSERLSSAGERASRAAARMVRRLDESAAELEGLAVRLGPIDAVPESPAAGTSDAGAETAEDAGASLEDPDLRLLGPRDVQEPRSQSRPGDRS